ncbi:hypothetical protein AAHB34_02380 [Paenarthrobacter ureafaciens]
MKESPSVSRRNILTGAGAVALVAPLAVAGTTPANAAPGPDTASGETLSKGRTRMRPDYHLSVPNNWKNDPQRPIYLDGEYHYYYLYNADYISGGGGTSWRRVTTTDHVTFRDRGVAIPKFTNNNGDCWSGSLVVDDRNTAGYGVGAVIAILTQAPGGRQGAVPLVLHRPRPHLYAKEAPPPFCQIPE